MPSYWEELDGYGSNPGNMEALMKAMAGMGKGSMGNTGGGGNSWGAGNSFWQQQPPGMDAMGQGTMQAEQASSVQKNILPLLQHLMGQQDAQSGAINKAVSQYGSQSPTGTTGNVYGQPPQNPQAMQWIQMLMALMGRR